MALISMRFPFFMIDPTNNNRLFLHNPIEDLTALVLQGYRLSARRLLLLAGQYPVCRIEDYLSEPLVNERLHFLQTQNLAEVLLSEDDHKKLNENGSVEITRILESRSFTINIFYGEGSHNLIVFYD